MDKRWIVTLHDGADSEDVGADMVTTTPAGALSFHGEYGDITMLYAPGVWKTVEAAGYV